MTAGSAPEFEGGDEGVEVEEVGEAVGVEVGGSSLGAGEAFEAINEGVEVEEVDEAVAGEVGRAAPGLHLDVSLCGQAEGVLHGEHELVPELILGVAGLGDDGGVAAAVVDGGVGVGVVVVVWEDVPAALEERGVVLVVGERGEELDGGWLVTWVERDIDGAEDLDLGGGVVDGDEGIGGVGEA